jgi:hypothetical protein
LGAGQVAATLWNDGNERNTRKDFFTLYRMNSRTGRVGQLFRSADLHDLIKLCQALAAVLAEDDGLPTQQCQALADLALRLDDITRTRS